MKGQYDELESNDKKLLDKIEKEVIGVLVPDCSEKTIQETIKQRLRQEFKDKIRESDQV